MVPSAEILLAIDKYVPFGRRIASPHQRISERIAEGEANDSRFISRLPDILGILTVPLPWRTGNRNLVEL